MNIIMKTILFAIALAFIGQTSVAKNAVISENISDDTTFFKKNVVQILLEQCSRIDTFYVVKGIMQGNIEVFGENNETLM